MKYLLVALETEIPDIKLPDDFTLMITGVGKVNAAMMTTLAVTQKDCELVINYGTAGALDKSLLGELHRVNVVKQRDMDARPQAELGVTPFEETAFNSDISITDNGGVSLSTGDNFVTDAPELESDLVDMEGYAIAKVCGMFNKPVAIYKYASDLADADAAEAWQENQASGLEKFLDRLKADGVE